MSPKKQLIIWGAGGHAMVVADIVRLAETHEIIGFVDDVNKGRESFLSAPIISDRSRLAGFLQKGAREIFIAIGNCPARLRLAGLVRELGFTLATLVHPQAVIASGATIGAGTVVAAGAVVNPGVTIGENVIINTCASVDHECTISDGAHICPGVRLAGKVSIGRGSWIGIGTSVIDGIRIGENVFIGAGAVVVKDIPDGVLAKGVPARIARRL